MHVFTKILSTSDTKARLEVPKRALEHFTFSDGQHYQDLMVRDSAQNVWRFRLTTRKRGNHPKPALTAQWLEFVKAKGLEKQDEIILHRQEEEAAVGGVQYRIDVQKKSIKLFGNVIRLDGDN